MFQFEKQFKTKTHGNFWNKEGEAKPNALTENSREAYKSTKFNLLDIFYKIGNMRDVDDAFMEKVRLAYREDKEGLLAVLLWARDCRQGAGRRNVPRIVLRHWFENGNLLNSEASQIMNKLVELGRWDDVWAVALDTKYERMIGTMVRNALTRNDGLCAKWLPRKGPVAARIRKLLDMSPKQYRKTIVNLTKVVETPICEGRFHEIDYSHVPSQAMNRYRNLFSTKDNWRFEEWKESLTKNTAKVNVKTLYPHQIIKNVFTDAEFAQAQWKTKVKEVRTKRTSFLPVIDVSGSMTQESGARGFSCMDVAVSVGMLLSEGANNAFNGRFVTFSRKPQLMDLRGFRVLREKVRYVTTAEWGFNTNVDAVFDLILMEARTYGLDQDELPEYILILSDMQFDGAVDNRPAIKTIKRKYKRYGYEAPTVVFWNVANTYDNVPAVKNENGCILISGFNTNLLEQLIDSPKNINPMMFLDKVINNPRYRVALRA